MWLLTALSILTSLFSPGYAAVPARAEQAVTIQDTDSGFGTPAELKIPVIGLDTPVVPVGLNERKLVDVPPTLAGWYAGGAIPGETGNATFQGHVTQVFRNINKLNQGDILWVKDAGGRERKFEVKGKELVRKQQFDVQKVYGDTNRRRLNLITCAGNFDIRTKDFDQRMIIYSELAAE